MFVELVHTKTADGVRLHGALHDLTADRGQEMENTRRSVDAVVSVHGVGSNFYSSTMMDSICETLHAHGITTLRINTRGHDGVATVSTDTGGRMQGAAYEIVDDCRLDLAAWTSFLTHRGFARIAWLGHSLGAIKVLYAQAYQPHPAVRRVIAISPPRLAHSRLTKGPDSTAFTTSWADAQRLMAKGQPTTLFSATFPFPIVLSAATFSDKYGPAERYNVLRFTSQICGPINLIFGQQELTSSNLAFADFDRELAAAAWGDTSPEIDVIAGANHFYSGCFPQLVQTIRGCL